MAGFYLLSFDNSSRPFIVILGSINSIIKKSKERKLVNLSKKFVRNTLFLTLTILIISHA
jgi:hypothetical protein